MTPDEQLAAAELRAWQQRMQRRPSYFGRLTRQLQRRINSLIPERVHQAITVVVKQMVRGVLFGSRHTTRGPLQGASWAEREATVRQRIRYYQTTAATEGALTGAAGFFVGLADFPLLLALKLKMLFDIAALYGYDVKDYTERLYLLHVLQLTFSSQHNRNKVYRRLANWETYRHTLPPDAVDFNWRTFQQEYRDYLDLAKLAQLLPVIGAAVGAVANYKLIEQLGETAMNCYRMRQLTMSNEQ